MPKLPLGIAVEVARRMRLGLWEPLPVGANYVGHRTEGTDWIVIYAVAGAVYERRVPQWRLSTSEAEAAMQRATPADKIWGRFLQDEEDGDPVQ